MVVDALLDTSILIDLLRNHPKAIAWFSVAGNYGVTYPVWVEILEGARDHKAMESGIGLLQRFLLIPLTKEDHERSLLYLRKYWLSHRVDGNDCVIAAATERLDIPLYTRNLRYSRLLIPELAENPYQEQA